MQRQKINKLLASPKLKFLPGIIFGFIAVIALLLLTSSTVLPFIYSLF